MVTGEVVRIEKVGLPFVMCEVGGIRVEVDGLVIVGVVAESSNGYQFQLVFNDGNTITINGSEVVVTETLSQIPYVVDLKAQTMKVEFDG